jgi:hypothetical protein
LICDARGRLREVKIERTYDPLTWGRVPAVTLSVLVWLAVVIAITYTVAGGWG